ELEHPQGDQATPHITFLHNDEGNVEQSIYHMQDPMTGEFREQSMKRTFDTFHRPAFGLDYLYGTDLLPWRFYVDVWEMSLSEGNITEEHGSGNTYTYTYNASGYPSTITMKWKDVETEEPMMLRIEYIAL